MKLRGVLTLALGLAAGTLAVRQARAEPTIWQRARDPRSARVERAFVRIERMLDGVAWAEGDADMMQDFRKATLVVAEMTGARALADPKLLVLLAQALIGADVDQEDEALGLLERALAQIGPNERWLEAEIRPLMAEAMRSDARRALSLVERALPLVWERSGRSLLLRERAEARMALGDVRGSGADAALALDCAGGPIQRALARYVAALALERSGDLPGALAEVKLAKLTAPALPGSELGVLGLRSVFVFRPNDSLYVTALSAMASARDSEGADALIEYERALVAWQRYAASVPADDPWLPNARIHAEKCERARRALGASAESPPDEDSGGLF